MKQMLRSYGRVELNVVQKIQSLPKALAKRLDICIENSLGISDLAQCVDIAKVLDVAKRLNFVH